jgi:hypothetical protein
MKTVFLSDLNPSQRKTVRDFLFSEQVLVKKRVELFEKSFIKPSTDLLVLNKRVLKGDYPINFYVKQSKKLAEHYVKIFKK